MGSEGMPAPWVIIAVTIVAHYPLLYTATSVTQAWKGEQKESMRNFGLNQWNLFHFHFPFRTI